MCNLSTIGTDRQEALMQVLREDGGSQIVRERHRMDEGHVMSLLELRNGLYLLNVRSLSLLFDRNIERAYLLQCDPLCECCAKGGTHFPLLLRDRGELVVQYQSTSEMRVLRMRWPPTMERDDIDGGVQPGV